MHGAVCPVPLQQKSTIVIGHGSGGKMMHDLISEVFIPAFGNPILAAGNDAGLAPAGSNSHYAISTDAHVVKPLFFPGGDIGKLAVCGTVNDVAMLGAIPKYLAAGFILEEGLDISILSQVVQSMRESAEEAGIQIVAGDTKVVEKGKADGLYITTAGFGEIIPYPHPIGGQHAQPGDRVILSGTLGDHGIAVLGARGDLGFESDVKSDIAPLNHLIHAILQVSDKVHVLRDPTRGGLATSLNEIAKQSQVGIILDEKTIPVKPAVQSACEMLGFDPLYIANEGKLIVICAAEDEEKVLATMRKTDDGQQAIAIGEIITDPPGRVLMKTLIGSHRVVDILAGELLPRIC
ncbi:MAG: hydrogenase expression/formation protein HypE [Anaerolineales bacterium]|nr:hydrogenase expression/formation protein HypE [Anaerolineales bacterium]